MHKFIFLFLFISCLGFSQSEQPNVLFVISDDQSAMHAGAYGDIATNTPAFQMLDLSKPKGRASRPPRCHFPKWPVM